MGWRTDSLVERRCSLTKQKVLPYFGLVLGVVGVLLVLVDVLGITYQWQFSISVIFLILVFLAVGGPIIVSKFLTGNLENITQLDVFLLVGFVLSFIFSLVLARMLRKDLKRWELFGFISPFLPPLILSIISLRVTRNQAKIVSSTQPATAAAPAASSEPSSLSAARIRGLAETILRSNSFGMEQIRSRDELREHQGEPGVKQFFVQMMEEEIDIRRRLMAVRVLGDLSTAWARDLLIHTAYNDPYTATADEFYPSSDPDVEARRGELTIWPVREAAEKALKKTKR
jgi:hypothetical protein